MSNYTNTTETLSNGVVVRVVYSEATYQGHPRGEFYSGIRKGDRVTVETRTATLPSGVEVVSLSIRKNGAWLGVYDASLLTD